MLIHVFTNGCDVCAVPGGELESRVWLASQRAAGRLSRVGARLTCAHDRRSDAAARRVAACQIDAWLRGGGLVSVRHADADAPAAVGRAAVRLERALARRLRAAAGEAPSARATGGGGSEDYRHAERRWEDDGGRVGSAGRRLKRRAADAAASRREFSAHDIGRLKAIIRLVRPASRTGRVRELART